MASILLIETSTALCSAALAADGKIAAYRESSEPRAHASKAAVFVKEILDEQGITVKDCDAVCVCAGPGSYTGLRVGVSTAKGLCFGAGIPLLSVTGTDVLAAAAIRDNLLPPGCKYIIPMIDARRMEVYSAVYDNKAQRLSEISPVIVDGNSYAGWLEQGPVLFIGDGAEKCRDILGSENAFFEQRCPDAKAMLGPATAAFERGEWQDCAYFEPFYLKQFMATESKKKMF